MPYYLQHLSLLDVDEMWIVSTVKYGRNSVKIAKKADIKVAAYSKI